MLYIKGYAKKYHATGEFDKATNHMTVFKGAVISSKSTIKKGSQKRERLIKEKVVKGILQEDMIFRSPSTAATFVSGTSMNGYLRWQDEKGENLKTILEKVDG